MTENEPTLTRSRWQVLIEESCQDGVHTLNQRIGQQSDLPPRSIFPAVTDTPSKLSSYKAFIRHQPAALLLVGLLLAGIAHGLRGIMGLAKAHWLRPNLFGDSFSFVSRGGGKPLLGWLTDQHNEHRIVWAKIASVVEVEWFNIPPGQSALFQSLALILASAGLWAWLCHRLLQRSDLRLITALAGWLLLVNPWQLENMGWEFQTPWFLTNALVLGSALMLSMPLLGPAITAGALLLPWIAIANTGQGLAAAAAFAISAWLRSRRLGVLVTASSALAAITNFALLPYSKPLTHPELSFNPTYFLRAWLGGHWQGLTLLVLVSLALVFGRHRMIPRAAWPALLVPTLFSLFFAGMITISRSGFGVEQAFSSRYITHSLMIGLSALMALALVDDRSRQSEVPLLGGCLAVLITVGSIPQSILARGITYSDAWSWGRDFAGQRRQALICHAHRATKRYITSPTPPCDPLHDSQAIIDRYFQGSLPVKPLGWHRALIETASPMQGSQR